jgi:hypothetical protein
MVGRKTKVFPGFSFQWQFKPLTCLGGISFASGLYASYTEE